MYKVKETIEHHIKNWDESLGDPYIIVNSEGFDEFGEAFSKERAEQLCNELNIENDRM
jgi:hypothetical protein